MFDDGRRVGLLFDLFFGPLLVISTAIAGLVLGPDAAHGEIAAQVEGLLGSAGAQALETLLAAANRPYQGALATIFGIGHCCSPPSVSWPSSRRH